jgi:hypothetical protein
LHAWLEALLSRRLQLSYVVQMADNFFNVHHIHVFMMQVEQVHLVAQFNAIIVPEEYAQALRRSTRRRS